MTTEQSDLMLRVLQIVAAHDDHEVIWWRADEEYAPVQFFVRCNDFFHWGCADLERVTSANVEMLEAAYRDATLAGDKYESWGALLFCARVRKTRPQGAAYPNGEDATQALIALFDACGPKRDVDFGNPHKHPNDGGEYAYSETSPVTSNDR